MSDETLSMEAVDRLRQDLDDLVALGAIAAVAHVRTADGEYAAASGVTEVGGDTPADPAGYFRIGSVTKTYTATAVMQLVGDGVLGLDDTVERWLPGVVPNGDRITVRRLLDHSAGLYNYTNAWMDENGPNLPVVLASGARAIPPAEVVADAVARPVNFAPGESISYDNTGYLLAGMVIEAAGGRAYSEHITDRILRPLDLNQTVVRWGPELPEPHAHGYVVGDGEPIDVTTFDRTAAGAAGGMVSTAGDVNRFFAGLFGGVLLGAAELAEMAAPTPWNEPGFRAGLGMISTTLESGVDVIGKDGGFLGYRTWSFHTLSADRQLTLSVTTAEDVPVDTAQILARFAYVFG